MKTIYEEKGLKPQVWVELRKRCEKVESGGFVAHAGFSREGLPFNIYNENLFLVIECENDDMAWKLNELLDKAVFHLPTDLQEAKSVCFHSKEIPKQADGNGGSE